MLRSDRNDSRSKTELLTKDGAISDKQLRKAVKFLSYGEQVGSIVTSLLVAGVATAVGGAAVFCPRHTKN